MMQGDSYYMGIAIKNNAGSTVTPADVKDVEITIGHITKTYLGAQVLFADGLWFFPIDQKDSFQMLPSSVRAQVRVVWANGVIEGKPLYGIKNLESISKEVL